MNNIFCTKCGEKTENVFTFSHYHPSNGEKLFTVVSVCPKKKFWNSHTKHKRTIEFMGDIVRNIYYYEDGRQA